MLVVLALFLNTRLAFWVALGIPVSMLGACAVLLYSGETLNMLTMFAFMMALGIVVDDAIVIGENISAHREMGKSLVQAAVDGAAEVIPSVFTSIATTVMTFMPLFFVTGIMGKFIACMPAAMIAMLVISLLESTFILPCHLAHAPHEPLTERARRMRGNWSGLAGTFFGTLLVWMAMLLEHVLHPVVAFGRMIDWSRRQANRLLQTFAERFYLPLLGMLLRNVGLALSISFVILLGSVAMVSSGTVPFVGFPKMDSNQLQATVTFPNGTPSHMTAAATEQMAAALERVNQKYADEGGVVKLMRTSVGFTEGGGRPGQTTSNASGGHVGGVSVELRDTAERSVSSAQITAEWRAETGPIAGVETLNFASQNRGPGGTPIEFKLLANSDNLADLEAAVERSKARLAEFPGVFDIADDALPGKWEYRLKIKDDALAMGVTLADLAETVRASYYGAEVMRLQRGRHEVKLMVRYPAEDRRSLKDFEDIMIRTDPQTQRPLSELADVEIVRGLTEINRIDQQRSITVSADVDESLANAKQIVNTLRAEFMPELQNEYPLVSVRWEGQQERDQESFSSLGVGLGIAMICMFALLTLEFKSYLQPAIVMAVIPFGVVGAIGGHWVMGLPLTLFSTFGLVALTGVVVNDSIVLVDFINHRIRDGLAVEEALLDAGRRRLRPVLLTSVTTIAGLLPLLTERSFQAQMIVPMAVSLAFGLMASTVMVLLLIPVFYSLYARVTAQHDGAEHPAEDWAQPHKEPAAIA